MDTPRRHHYIPQFLLRGFTSRATGQETYVWMFRHSASKPVETNIKNVGQQRDFHGDPAVSDVEFQMREYENRLAALVERLRREEPSASDSAALCELVVHMTVRTKNLRAGMSSAVDTMLARMGEKIPKANTYKLKQQIRKEARKEFKQSGLRDVIKSLPRDKQKLAKQMVNKAIRENDFRPELSKLFGTFLDQVDVKQITANAHIKSLPKAVDAPARIAALGQLTWEPVTGAPHTWILGDVLATGRFGASPQLRSLVNPSGTVELVMLPISDTVCIVGRSSPDVLVPSAEETNCAAAELSREFFVASTSGDRERAYAEALGRRAEIMSEEEISDAVKDVF